MMKMEWQGLLIRQRNPKSLMKGWAHNKRQRNERWKVWLRKMKVIKIVNKMKCECRLLLCNNFCSITGRILLLRLFLMFFFYCLLCLEATTGTCSTFHGLLSCASNLTFLFMTALLYCQLWLLLLYVWTLQFQQFCSFLFSFCLKFTQILCNCAANCLSICSAAEPSRCFPPFISLCVYTYMYVCVRFPCIVLPFRQ